MGSKLLFVIALVVFPMLAHAECGWLLMVPPVSPGPKAPMVEWRQEGAFDSARDCVAGQASLATAYKSWEAGNELEREAYKMILLFSRCLPASQVTVR